MSTKFDNTTVISYKFNQLPMNMILTIAQHMTLKDLIQFIQTNKKHYNISKTQYFNRLIYTVFTNKLFRFQDENNVDFLKIQDVYFDIDWFIFMKNLYIILQSFQQEYRTILGFLQVHCYLPDLRKEDKLVHYPYSDVKIIYLEESLRSILSQLNYMNKKNSVLREQLPFEKELLNYNYNKLNQYDSYFIDNLISYKAVTRYKGNNIMIEFLINLIKLVKQLVIYVQCSKPYTQDTFLVSVDNLYDICLLLNSRYNNITLFLTKIYSIIKKRNIIVTLMDIFSYFLNQIQIEKFYYYDKIRQYTRVFIDQLPDYDQKNNNNGDDEEEEEEEEDDQLIILPVTNTRRLQSLIQYFINILVYNNYTKYTIQKVNLITESTPVYKLLVNTIINVCKNFSYKKLVTFLKLMQPPHKYLSLHSFITLPYYIQYQIVKELDIIITNKMKQDVMITKKVDYMFNEFSKQQLQIKFRELFNKYTNDDKLLYNVVFLQLLKVREEIQEYITNYNTMNNRIIKRIQ